MKFEIGQRTSGRIQMVPLGNGVIVDLVKDGIERGEPMYKFRPDNGDGSSYPLYESELHEVQR